MNLCLINNSFKYELEKLVRIFLPFQKIIFLNERVESEKFAVAEIDYKNNKAYLIAELYINKKNYIYKDICNDINNEKELEIKLATLLFNCFTDATEYHPQWGILTGVRPAKLFSKLSKSMGIFQAKKYFKDILKVSDNKISLCEEAIKGESKIISLSRPDSFSLYISIPFCPTRCSYCSFVSHSIDKAKNLIPDYTKLVCKELEITAKIAKQCNLRLETIYIGGGTPTAISAEQIDIIMQTVNNNFNLSYLREYTVEAGRPDTFTEEKLNVIKQNGATRISINPQTMNDSVLSAIGRRHTSKQTIEAFNMARRCGFNNINMDLIAGLPTDTEESFKNTVQAVSSLNPESVTVHSLSMKRSSDMTKSGEFLEVESGIHASNMVDYSRLTLTSNGLLPYYMYRQSKTVGNLENVGYSKPGFECLYNVYIMDETHTILACGASAVTKLREPMGDNIERIFNFKYPYEYISRFDEIIKRKDGIIKYYEIHSTKN